MLAWKIAFLNKVGKIIIGENGSSSHNTYHNQGGWVVTASLQKGSKVYARLLPMEKKALTYWNTIISFNSGCRDEEGYKYLFPFLFHAQKENKS